MVHTKHCNPGGGRAASSRSPLLGHQKPSDTSSQARGGTRQAAAFSVCRDHKRGPTRISSTVKRGAQAQHQDNLLRTA